MLQHLSISSVNYLMPTARRVDGGVVLRFLVWPLHKDDLNFFIRMSKEDLDVLARLTTR